LKGLTFVVDTWGSPFATLRPVPIENVNLEDSFWAPRLESLREVTLPSQYRLLEETGRLHNFRRASGKVKGEFRGYYFNDSDVYKWVEATSFLLAYSPNERLSRLVREVISEIVSAQDEDGYLNTYFTFDLKERRWKDIRSMHELYCAGHLIQAAIAYYRATGEVKFLNSACKFADHIASVFGDGKRLGTPGHPEIEMALVELYRTTKRRLYLDLAIFFIDNRGLGLVGGDVNLIDHKPFRELEEIVGHAVRSVYLNCGVTDVYMETGDKTLFDALTRLWDNMTNCKIYITGGVGSRYCGEAFGSNYELPNAGAYAETCASVANVMWNWRMLLATGDCRFADVMELVLYNAALAGISIDGKRYFYVNPLADRGQHQRQEWFRCACCPPNIARLLAYLPGYVYSVNEEGLWVHIYVGSKAWIHFKGTRIVVVQRTKYPWSGEVSLILQPERKVYFSLYLRIPGWCRKACITVNGKEVEEPVPGRYFKVTREWKPGDHVQLRLAMPVEKIVCHPYVMENNDRVAIKRGLIVYCVEQNDNPNFDVWNLILTPETKFKVEWKPNLFNGVTVIRGRAKAVASSQSKMPLYSVMDGLSPIMRNVEFTAIPYYAWANRKPGPMTVWIRYQNSDN